jgi:hypothetical protein
MSCSDPFWALPVSADFAVFNGDGASDIAVATTGRFSPSPVVLHVLLSRCE